MEKENKEKKQAKEEKKKEVIEKDNKDNKKVEKEPKQEKSDNKKEQEQAKRLEELKKASDKKRKRIIISVICAVVALVLIILFSTVFALFNINNTKIISKVYVGSLNLSGLTQEEATQKLTEELEQKVSKNVNLKTEDFEYQIQLSQVEVNYNINKAIQDAYNIGRDGNIFVNNFNILKSMFKGNNINLEYTYNEELLNDIVEEVALKIPNAVKEPNYSIEDDTLIITKGKKGNTINKDKLKNDIIHDLEGSTLDENIDLEVVLTEPEAIDIEKIHDEVYTEPKDAYYTKDPFEIFPHVNGVDFDVDKAKELLKKDKEEYEIKLIITEPDVTTNEIGTEAFPDLLSSFSTRYDASNTPRTTNLKLVMEKLDGVVVSPGETFSYNQTVGKRTAEAGYKEAGGYAAGGVVQTLAGGICQISSTLYDAVVYANLDIVERHNHMFLAGYVGAGKDATVVYGSLDFKFKNTRKYPIMIKTTIGGGIAKIDIYGVKEDVEYDVDIVTTILNYTPFDVVYKNDSSLSPGKEVVEQNGMNGCKSITYKVLKLNGAEVSREVLSSDTYDPMDKIVRRGTKKTTSTSTSNTSNKTDSKKDNKDDKKTNDKTNNKTETDKKNNNTNTVKENTNTVKKDN